MIRILPSTRLGERRWTQADLARMTGIRPSTINEMYHEMAERVKRLCGQQASPAPQVCGV